MKMTSREQFYEWFYEYTACDPNDIRYVDMVEMYWMAWKASREAIEVQACPCPNDHGPYVDDHYREQINNAGLKLKK